MGQLSIKDKAVQYYLFARMSLSRSQACSILFDDVKIINDKWQVIFSAQLTHCQLFLIDWQKQHTGSMNHSTIQRETNIQFDKKGKGSLINNTLQAILIQQYIYLQHENCQRITSLLMILRGSMEAMKQLQLEANLKSEFNKNIMKSIQVREEMKQTQYKLKTTTSRDDCELHQILLLKYDPQLIQDIFIHVSPSQIVHPQHRIASYTLRQPVNNSEQQPTSNQFHLFTNSTGIVESISDCFEQISIDHKRVYRLKEVGKKGNLQLLCLKECDHRPRQQTMLGNNFNGQYTNVQIRSGTVNICNICQEVLWKYYDSQEIEISLQTLCNINSIHNLDSMLNHFTWTIIKNQQFTKTTQIGKLQNQEVTIPYLAKATFLIDFDQYRKKINQKTIVMKIRKVICKHEKIIDQRCQFCLQQIKIESVAKKTYFYQEEGMRGNRIMTGNALRMHEEQYIQKLLKTKKAILILDLDNTILHSIQISQLELNTVSTLKDFYIIPKIQCFNEQEIGRKDLIIVKMRPFFKQFIFVVTKFYQIFVYTKGTKPYAQQICKYIRSQYAGQERTHPYLTWKPQRLLFLKDKKAFSTNIITRNEDNNIDSKSFQNILPSRTEYHLILDDRRDVWNNSNAWFFTRDYLHFFKRVRQPQEYAVEEDISQYIANEDLDMPQMRRQIIQEYQSIRIQYPEKQSTLVYTNQIQDYYLLFAAYALRLVHKNFFQALKTQKAERQYQLKNKEQKPQQSTKSSKVNLSYQYVKTKYFMKGCRIRYFLGEGQTQGNSNTIRRGKKMGVVAVEDDTPKLIIRANDLMKQTKKPVVYNPSTVSQSQMEEENPNYYSQQKKKLQQLFNSKIPVVSQTWIHYCYQFNYPFSYQPFQLKDPFKVEVSHDDFKNVIQSEAKLILANIQKEMQKQYKLQQDPHHAHSKPKKSKHQQKREGQQ